tara:strand:+ start:8001 stop:11561 length:3561 start_codon:yes stop_codon:yes gene_type:complete
MSTFFTYNTDFNDSFADATGLDNLSAHGSVVTDSSIERGWRFTGTSSIDRMQELSNIRSFSSASPEQRQATYDAIDTYGKRRLQRHGYGRYGATRIGGLNEEKIKEKYGVDFEMLEPDVANDKFGVAGHLKFNEPISNIEAMILQERKEQELGFNFIMDKAHGMEYAKGMSLEMGTALVDPVTIPLMFIPPLGLGKIAGTLGFSATRVVGGKVVGTTAGRATTGALGGFYGSAAIEPLIYTAAQQEQANYGLAQSFINIAFGTIAGGGLHVVGGKVYDGVRHIRSKRNAKAFNTAANQLGNGQNVEVTPITNMSDEPQFPTPKNDGDALSSPLPKSDDGVAPQQVDVVDSDVAPKIGDVSEYKPHGNAQESETLYRQNDSSGAAKISAVKLKTLVQNDPELTQAIAATTDLGKANKIGFRIKTKQGHYVVVRPQEGQPLRIIDSDQLGASDLNDLSFGEKVHKAMMMHGIDMAEGDFKYNSSVKLGDDGIHHIVDVENVDFNPKMNQHDVVIAPLNDIKKLFEGEAGIGVFNSGAKGKAAIDEQLAEFKEGSLLASQDQKGSFDEALLDVNLTKTGDQLGTQPGGIHTDAATGQQYYVKYPVQNGKPATDIIKSEFLAAVLYRQLGVSMPTPRLIANEAGEIVGIASEMIPGAKMITPKEFASLPDASQEAFAEHALIDMFLGNWDVVGNAPNYNMMLLPNGFVTRIDPGGALIYRAQGGKKDIAAMTQSVGELKSMLDPSNTSGEVLGIKLKGLSADEFAKAQEKAAVAIFSLNKKDMDSLVDSLQFSKAEAAEMKQFLNARQDILKQTPGFENVTTRTSTKLGTIMANSYSNAQKALSKMAKDIKNNLNPKQKGIVKSYTGSGYISLNKWLRGQLSVLEEVDFANSVRKYTDFKDDPTAMPKDVLENYSSLLDSAIEASTPNGMPKSIELWRGGTPFSAFNNIKGLSLKGSGVDQMPTAQAMVGGHVILSGFTSAGLHQGSASNFMNSQSVWIRIKTQKGQKALYTKKSSDYSHSTNETEIILPRDQEYVVTGVTPQGGKNAKHGSYNGYVIELEAVLPGQDKSAIMPKSQAISVAEKYHKEPSNAVSDIKADDADLNILDGSDIKQTTLKIDEGTELKQTEQQIAELTELINAELPNMPPQYVASMTKVLDDINAQAEKDVVLAQDLYEAAKAAAVCVFKGGA